MEDMAISTKISSEAQPHHEKKLTTSIKYNLKSEIEKIIN